MEGHGGVVDEEAGEEFDSLFVGAVHHEVPVLPLSGQVEEAAAWWIEGERLSPLKEAEVEQAFCIAGVAAIHFAAYLHPLH